MPMNNPDFIFHYCFHQTQLRYLLRKSFAIIDEYCTHVYVKTPGYYSIIRFCDFCEVKRVYTKCGFKYVCLGIRDLTKSYEICLQRIDVIVFPFFIRKLTPVMKCYRG